MADIIAKRKTIGNRTRSRKVLFMIQTGWTLSSDRSPPALLRQHPEDLLMLLGFQPVSKENYLL